MPQIDYLQVVVLLLCMSWFVKGARMDMRSPLVWGSLSLGMWLVFTQLLGFSIFGGIFSQLLLIAGLAGWEELRERRAKG